MYVYIECGCEWVSVWLRGVWGLGVKCELWAYGLVQNQDVQCCDLWANYAVLCTLCSVVLSSCVHCAVLWAVQD